MMHERHRKISAALQTLHEVFNADGGQLGVILIVAPQRGDGVASDYGSSIADRRRVLAILKEKIRLFEEQLGAAA